MSSSSFEGQGPNEQNLTGVSTYFDPSLNKVVRDLTDRQANVPVIAGQVHSVIEDDEEGFLIAFSITVDSPDVIMEVVAYGDDGVTPILINNLSMKQLLRLGFGLTPGDVEVQPDGDSQDKSGDRDTAFPWLVRYKVDVQPDMFDEQNSVITLKYTPTLYHHYKRLVINMINISPDTVNVIYLSVIRRIVYDRIPPGGLPARVANKGEYSTVNMKVGSIDEYNENQLSSDINYGEEGGTEVAVPEAGDTNKDYNQLAPDPGGEEQVVVEEGEDAGNVLESDEGSEVETNKGEKVTYHEA